MQGVIILFVTLLVWGSSFSWGECTETSPYSIQCSSLESYGAPSGCSYHYSNCNQTCSSLSGGVFGNVVYKGPVRGEYNGAYCYCIFASRTYCSNETEADSVACVNEGGQWVLNSQGNKYCAKSYCTAEDTLNLQREIAHCDSMGATNNFALANNEECSLTGICNLCSGNAYRNYVQNLKERCCELGKIPDSVKCVIKDITSTQNTYAELQGDGCLSTGGSVNITPNGETIVEGCENFNSSSSQNQSSDSQNQSSSSECIGLDCPSSDSKNLDDISADLEDIKDSLHRIIIYDSTTASNSIDLVNYLYDIKTCLEAGTCGNGQVDYTENINEVRDTIHHGNELLKQIADKDWSVNFSGGLTESRYEGLIHTIENSADSIAKMRDSLAKELQKAADSTAKYGQVNGEKLDSIIDGLKGIGMDSVAHKLDSMRNDKLDSISGGIYSLDSTFAYWGDSSNRKVDSAGWGGKYDSLKDWGDSLTGAMGDWLEGCDTTGGKHCDNIYIGSHGLDSATSGMKGAAGALRDSMLNGRFADSLNLWASKFNNPKITGSGSNTCPSALTRSYSLNFGSMGEVQMGSFGTYLCEPIFGSVTPWTLGRILLRAIVAISCMWFLFKCATGFKGDSGEED